MATSQNIAEELDRALGAIRAARDDVIFRYREIEILRQIDKYIMAADRSSKLVSPGVITQLFKMVLQRLNEGLLNSAECGFYVNFDDRFELLKASNTESFPENFRCDVGKLDWKRIEASPLHSQPKGQPFTEVFSNAFDVYSEPLFIFDDHVLGVFVVQGFQDKENRNTRWLKDKEHVDTLRGIFRQLKIAYRFLVEHKRSTAMNELWGEFADRQFSPHICLKLLASNIVQMLQELGPLRFQSNPEVQILFPYDQALRILATTGEERDIETVPISDSVSGIAFSEDKVLNIDPTSDEYSEKYRRYFGRTGEIRSELAVPMKAKNEVVGIVNFESHEVNAFRATQVRTLEEIVQKVTPVAISLKSRLDHNRDAQMAYSSIMSGYLARFSSVLRHELASPTSALQTNFESALIRAEENERDKDALKNELGLAEENFKSIQRTIFDFIEDFSRYGDVEPICINDLVKEVIVMIEDTDRANVREAGVEEFEFNINYNPKERHRVRASRLLKPYLICLFDNSIRSIKAKRASGKLKKPGTIRVVIGPDCDLPGYIVISIKDNGQGVSKHELELLRRFRAGTRFRASPGDGYGLAATQRYLTEVGGWIAIDSVKNRSFTVKLTLKHET